MKRYNIDAPSSDQYEEAADGEWVKYADVIAELKDIAERSDDELKALQLAQAIIGAHNVNVARLATATALVKRWMSTLEPDKTVGGHKADLLIASRAFLANQPAAPARTEAERVTFTTVQGQTLSSCTMADVEVLKAMDAVPTATLRDWRGLTVHVRHIPACFDLGVAELARRGLKP